MFLQCFASDAIDGPVLLRLRAKGEIEVDARTVPVEAPSFEASASALDRDTREFLEDRLAVALARVLGTHIEVFEINARPTEESRADREGSVPNGGVRVVE